MVAHRVVSPAMFGVKTAGQLGSTQELEVASQLFNRQVIEPYQRVINKALKSIFQAAGVDNRVFVVESKPVSAEEVVTKEITADFSEADVLDIDLALDFLIELGEDETEEWQCIDSRKVNYDEEKAQDAMWSFANVIAGGKPEKTPSQVSKQDNKLIKIRYAYMPKNLGGFGTNPSTGEEYKSRSFCTKMVNAGNKVWAKEQIELASTKIVNRGWGPGGANTYDLFLSHCESERCDLYKGGGSCQHFWERRTYLRKGNKQISVNKAKKIMREAGYDPMEVNSRKVAKRPRDMDGRGFIDGRGNWTTPRN